MLKLRKEELPRGGAKYVIYWDNERGGTFDSFEVVRDSQCGGTVIHRVGSSLSESEKSIKAHLRPLLYLYPGTDTLIAEALMLLIREREENIRIRNAEREVERTQKVADTFGYHVDLNNLEAIAILSNCETITRDGRVMVYVNGWKDLCRTDLKDDVCTWSPSKANSKEQLEFYKKKVQFGARTDNGRFAVVDSFSDG